MLSITKVYDKKLKTIEVFLLLNIIIAQYIIVIVRFITVQGLNLTFL